MKTTMKHYTIGERIRQTLIIIGVIANIALWGAVAYQELTKPEPVKGVDWYPMANQNIEWTWAGKEGTK